MKLPQPKINKGSYPNGKAFWLVSCMLSGQRYRKKHDTEQSALQDRVRLLRTGTSGLTAREHVATEQAVHVLKSTTNEDARNKDVLFAVEWFCEHFVDAFKVKPLRAYFDEFMGIKRAQGRRLDTIRELDAFLGKFVSDYEHANVTHLKFEDIEPWIISRSRGPASQKRNHHIVKHFFGFLSGQSEGTPNPHPILKASPFQGRDVIHQNDDIDDDTNIIIFTAEECRKLLDEASHHNAQRMFAWLLFTGMRPMESVRFWTEERWGWNLISEDLKYIRVPKAISKTRRSRIIAVSDTLQKWLACYRDFPSFMTGNWRDKYTWVRSKVLPPEKLKADIPRHTLISMMIKDGQGWAEIELQMGNKKDVQMRHYASLITSPNEVSAFYGLTPEKFQHDISEVEFRDIKRANQLAALAGQAAPETAISNEIPFPTPAVLQSLHAVS
jgi:hypothetical protein